MKRLLAGFAVLCMVTVTAGLTTSTPVSAGVPGFTTVTAVNAYSFAGGQLFDSTFCIDGVDKADLTTEQTSPPFTLAAGSVTVDFFANGTTTCDTGTPDATAVFELPDQGVVTLMAYWSGEGQAIAMLPAPLDCVAAGFGRLVVRNGADSKGGVIDLHGVGPDGISHLLVSNVAAGTQGMADISVGHYTDVVATEAGTLNQVALLGNVDIPVNSSTYEYVYGGNDGAPGSFAGGGAELDPCAVVTTTTTTAPATTTTTTAAPAVQATPAFTG